MLSLKVGQSNWPLEDKEMYQASSLEGRRMMREEEETGKAESEQRGEEVEKKVGGRGGG